MENRQLERIESLKAGLLGVGAIAPLLLILLSLSILLSNLGYFNPFSSVLFNRGLSTLIHWLEVAFCGFLFGVTYRYTVRQNIKNFQLKAGTVMAFALVRGVGLVDIGWQNETSWAFPLAWAGEGVLLFAIAAFLLDIALQQGWISPCKTPSE